MNKTLLASLTLLLTACGSKFTTATGGEPDPVSNELTGTTCDADNVEPVPCDVEECDSQGYQYCEAGEWGLCECDQSGESGGSTFVNTGGGSTGSIGGSGGESTGGNNTGGTGGGDISTGGTGGTGGSNTGGTGGETCIPENCEEIGERLTGVPGTKACGTLTDICGNEVTCSNDCNNDELYCGQSFWNDANNGSPKFAELSAEIGGTFYDKFTYPVNNNVCGESCIDVSNHLPCETGTYAIFCAENVVPNMAGNCLQESTGSDSYWCCDGSDGWNYMEKDNVIQ